MEALISKPMGLVPSTHENFPLETMIDMLKSRKFSAGMFSRVPFANLFPRVSFPVYGISLPFFYHWLPVQKKTIARL